MIDNEFTREWAEALRSGKYLQGIGKLRPTNITFCCLGVACDIYDSSKWNIPAGLSYWNWEDSRYVLPDTIIDDTGMSPFESKVLTTKNDNRVPFSEIADIIDQMCGRK